jgi:hypothetical protein
VHGFDAELVNVIEAWHKATHGSVAGQTLRKHLGWLLWREDVKPVDTKVCWSALIRQDLRDMPGPLSKKWRDLFAPMTFHLCSSPPAKWRKETAPLLQALGHEEFANWIYRWFKPFAGDKPLPLEATGSNVLRSLLWLCGEVEDQRVSEALSWYAKAEWKNKKSKSFTSKLQGPRLYALEKKPLVCRTRVSIRW